MSDLHDRPPYQPGSYPPMQQHQPPPDVAAQLKSGMLGVLLFTVGAGGGAGIVTAASSDEQPAVLAAAITDLRSDVQGIEDDLRGLRGDLQVTSQDRWRGTDHHSWISGSYRPHVEDFVRHTQLDGHPAALSRLDDLTRRVGDLERSRETERERRR